MNRRHYLKGVILRIEDETCRESCGTLRERLSGAGVFCGLSCAGEKLCARGADGAGRGAGEPPCEEMCRDASFLWMTDVPRCARELRRMGAAVLAVSHERNRDADFSQVPDLCTQPEELDAEYLERVYRRARGIPWDILETERCILRETTVEDVDGLYEIYRDPAVTRFTEALYPDREEEIRYTEDYIRHVYAFCGYGIWSVLDRATGKLIGRAGLTNRPGFEDPELGFVFGVEWQGRGLAGEVCGAILRYAREELRFCRVQSLVRPENAASARLCRRLGMQRTDTVELQGVPHDRYVVVLS